MNLQRPQATDLIAQLNARVTALEGANYNSNNPVDMFRLFNETPVASDTFTISTHTYHVCSTTLLCSTTLII